MALLSLGLIFLLCRFYIAFIAECQCLLTIDHFLNLAVVKKSEGNVLGNTMHGIAFFYLDLFEVNMETARIAFQKESVFFFTNVFFPY